MWFSRFMLESLPLFSMSIALILSWWNSSSSTTFNCTQWSISTRGTVARSRLLPLYWIILSSSHLFYTSAVSPLSTLIPWTSSLQCVPCSMVARQKTHKTTIWRHSGCWPLVQASDAGYLWCIWAISQPFPSHPHPEYLLRYIGKQWTSWCISWPSTWQILDVTPCGGLLSPASRLVVSARTQA